MGVSFNVGLADDSREVFEDSANEEFLLDLLSEEEWADVQQKNDNFWLNLEILCQDPNADPEDEGYFQYTPKKLWTYTCVEYQISKIRYHDGHK